MVCKCEAQSKRENVTTASEHDVFARGSSGLFAHIHTQTHMHTLAHTHTHTHTHTQMVDSVDLKKHSSNIPVNTISDVSDGFLSEPVIFTFITYLGSIA